MNAQISPICPEIPSSADDRLAWMLTALARARGCKSADEVGAFLDPLPPLVNPLLELSDIDKALRRIEQALKEGEAITIFGDYDCDGVTSVAQWINLFRAAGHTNYRVYIPDRFIEDYGLTPAAVEKCLSSQKPRLIIAVDCGSTSIEALELLKSKGVDVIVIDHHQVHSDELHPSFAHLNPKGDPRLSTSTALQDAALMSAAGLVFFVADRLAELAGIAKWDRVANLLLAGLGTYVDVMPLLGTNRALVKHSLAIANTPAIHRVIGLSSLLEANGWRGKKVTEYTYGFVLGPSINATGRLAHAKTSLSLLCALRPETARARAKDLVVSNNERKKIQDGICKEAFAQAEQILAAVPETKILVLYGKDWHTGIVGIVAGKIRERFGRPAIVMARLENGFWKGSGRSIPDVDIGGFVKRAVDAGIITAGGGHAMACGVKLLDGQVADFVSWVGDQGALLQTDLVAVHEVVGDADWLTTDQWVDFFNRGAPFGQGNPRPALFIRNAQSIWGPEAARKSDGTVWALRAGIRTPAHPAMTVTWTDLHKARLVLAPDQRIELACTFARNQGADGRLFDNWNVIYGELI